MSGDGVKSAPMIQSAAAEARASSTPSRPLRPSAGVGKRSLGLGSSIFSRPVELVEKPSWPNIGPTPPNRATSPTAPSPTARRRGRGEKRAGLISGEIEAGNLARLNSASGLPPGPSGIDRSGRDLCPSWGGVDSGIPASRCPSRGCITGISRLRCEITCGGGGGCINSDLPPAGRACASYQGGLTRAEWHSRA